MPEPGEPWFEAARLKENERRVLLELARRSIRDRLEGSVSAAELLGRIERTEGLEARRPVFVTLRERAGPIDAARLRGCMGSMSADQPIVESVMHLARRAAFEDPRFPPLNREELPRVRISISVLTEPRGLERPDSIEIGLDGVELVLGSRRAVFLPEVARELGWDHEELLSHLALKAGLPPNAWREATLLRFRSEAFGETDPPATADAGIAS